MIKSQIQFNRNRLILLLSKSLKLLLLKRNNFFKKVNKADEILRQLEEERNKKLIES